jgi:hypothetical protein
MWQIECLPHKRWCWPQDRLKLFRSGSKGTTGVSRVAPPTAMQPIPAQTHQNHTRSLHELQNLLQAGPAMNTQKWACGAAAAQAGRSTHLSYCVIYHHSSDDYGQHVGAWTGQRHSAAQQSQAVLEQQCVSNSPKQQTWDIVGHTYAAHTPQADHLTQHSMPQQPAGVKTQAEPLPLLPNFHVAPLGVQSGCN